MHAAQCPSEEIIASEFADGEAAETPLDDGGGHVPGQPPAAEVVLGGFSVTRQPGKHQAVLDAEEALWTGAQRGKDVTQNRRLLVPHPCRHKIKHLCRDENA